MARRTGAVLISLAALGCAASTTTGHPPDAMIANDAAPHDAIADSDAEPRDVGPSLTDAGSPESLDARPDTAHDAGIDACVDEDRDRYCSFEDCDDQRPDVRPLWPEACDDADNDCDGQVDEGFARSSFRDLDGDGFGDEGSEILTCGVRPGYTLVGGDCDDQTPSVHPGAIEVCDGAATDEDCDGTADEGCSCSNGTVRPCGSGLGICAAGSQTCNAGTWGPCSVAPLPETCNALDDDCDGTADNGVSVACYADQDGDTFAPAGSARTTQCPVSGRDAVGGCQLGATNRAPEGTAIDCDDTNPTRYPGSGC